MRASRHIAILALPKSDLFDIACPYEAFVRASQMVMDRQRDTVPYYAVDLLSLSGSMVVTWLGMKIVGAKTFTRYRNEPDTLIVTGRPEIVKRELQPQLDFWLRQRARQTRRICSVCTGVFCLAQAGLLDGKKATTHWQYAAELTERYPKIDVNPEPVFVRDGNLYTSAGSTAAMDLALALIEEDVGKAIAAEIAREMVMFVRRAGGQAQFSSLLAVQTSDREPLRDLQNWILENLHLPLTIEDLAERVHMSPRNFRGRSAGRFKLRRLVL